MKVHISDLNSVWNEVAVTLEDLSKDPKPLLKQQEIVPGAIVTKDEICEELFKDTDSETESLTEQCLRLLVCSSAILQRQLEDQLPGGKFFAPSSDIMVETAKGPKA